MTKFRVLEKKDKNGLRMLSKNAFSGNDKKEEPVKIVEKIVEIHKEIQKPVDIQSIVDKVILVLERQAPKTETPDDLVDRINSSLKKIDFSKVKGIDSLKKTLDGLSGYHGVGGGANAWRVSNSTNTVSEHITELSFVDGVSARYAQNGKIEIFLSGGGGIGTPASSVSSETSYGISPSVGVSTNYAREDHTHGTPAEPTKTTIGLGNVDNTSDINKPVSTAQATADSAVQSFSVQRSNHTGTQTASTISDFAATVIAIVLSGFSVAGTRTAIIATDTILQAFGKVQKYLNDLSAIAFSGSVADLSGTKAQFDTAVTDGNFMYIGDAPTTHTHTISDVTGLQTALDNKLDDTQFSGLSKISVGTTAPSSPSIGDLWCDSN